MSLARAKPGCDLAARGLQRFAIVVLRRFIFEVFRIDRPRHVPEGLEPLVKGFCGLGATAELDADLGKRLGVASPRTLRQVGTSEPEGGATGMLGPEKLGVKAP